MRKLMVAFLVPLVLAGVLSAPAEAASTEQILVRFRPSVATAAADAILASVGATTVGGVYASDVRIVRAPSGAMDVLNAQPTVEYAERDVAYRLLLSDPNDPRFDDQYAHRRISSVAGWASYPGSYTASGGATIAILDTGVDTDHPDLAGRIDTVNSTCTLGLLFCLFGIQDDHGHGTHVAGIAGAATNNGTGVAGVAFNAKLQIVKVCNAAGSCSLSAVASGINWARTHGAKVISMSLGGPSGSTTLRNAVQQADAAGAVIVAAAGNDGDPTLNYPAAYDEVISVASTTSSDSRSSFSNRNADVELTAPGSSVLSAYVGGTYATLSGTSMATPHVSGLAALLFGQNPSWTNTQVRTRMASCADDLGDPGRDPSFGFGRINLDRTLGSC